MLIDYISIHNYSLQATLSNCLVCSRTLFSDKAKNMTSASFVEVCPSYVSIGGTTCDVLLCSKCRTQIAIQQWPSGAANIGLTPDNNPAVLASLTPYEL